MDTNEKNEMAKKNIWQAIKDYRAHTENTYILDEISEDFVNRLAMSNTYEKEELRNLFRKSPVWNEELDALVINGTRTHDPDYDRIADLAEELLAPVRISVDVETNEKIENAIRFFTRPDMEAEELKESIEAIDALSPNAYAPNKKRSRIFKALCTSLGVVDNTAGSTFQRKYAQFADEITSRKIPFKLFVSLNPAHFLTMSNPKEDERGDMMTSCHSLNSSEDEYSCGCAGYARDAYTFIVFTATDPDVPETLNNRKNSRQIFAYKPGNGLLLQSRLYNTCGGTYGAQEDSKLYRDLIQREISELEGATNLWKTYDYYGNNICTIRAGRGYGGYHDWTYESFGAKISLRNDHEMDFETFTVGTYGLCICCGDNTHYGLYCDSCRPESDDDEVCDLCDGYCEERYLVIDHDGDEMYVCESCRSDRFTPCIHCRDYRFNNDMTQVHGGGYVCPDCLEAHYVLCPECKTYHLKDDTVEVDNHGTIVKVCEDCMDKYYEKCESCGEYFRKGDLQDGRCNDCNKTEDEAA